MMRIAVAGTHASGKSTLIADFLAAHPEFAHEPEPYEWLDDASAEPDAEDFYRQLEISVERLRGHGAGARVIAERSPLDFVAYILALGDLALIDAARTLAAQGMEHVDLLVVTSPDGIAAPEDEDPSLREAMHEHLLELVAEVEVCVVELHGPPHRRLVEVERWL